MHDTVTYLRITKGENAGWWVVYNLPGWPSHIRKAKGWRPENIVYQRPMSAFELRNKHRYEYTSYRYEHPLELLMKEKAHGLSDSAYTLVYNTLMDARRKEVES